MMRVEVLVAILCVTVVAFAAVWVNYHGESVLEFLMSQWKGQ